MIVTPKKFKSNTLDGGLYVEIDRLTVRKASDRDERIVIDLSVASADSVKKLKAAADQLARRVKHDRHYGVEL